MPRRPRIEIAGFYHVINRGVEQRVVFVDREDYEQFEELMCYQAVAHNITIHNYCLMSNHYHLLIEIKTENLSKFMRQLHGRGPGDANAIIRVPILYFFQHNTTIRSRSCPDAHA